MFQVLLVPEDQEGTKDLRDHLGSLARRGKRGTRVCQGWTDSEESWELQDHRVCQGQKVCQAHVAARELRAPEGQGAGQDLLAAKESRALPVCLGEMDSLVLRGHRVHRVFEDQWDQLANRGRGGQWDLWGHQDQRDHQGHQEYLSTHPWRLWALCLCRTMHQLLHYGRQVRFIIHYKSFMCIFSVNMRWKNQTRGNGHSVKLRGTFIIQGELICNTQYKIQMRVKMAVFEVQPFHEAAALWITELIQTKSLAVFTGCPAEWVNYRDKCYFFSKDLHLFDDAKAICESASASLLIISDMEEQVTSRAMPHVGIFVRCPTPRYILHVKCVTAL